MQKSLKQRLIYPPLDWLASLGGGYRSRRRDEILAEIFNESPALSMLQGNSCCPHNPSQSQQSE